MANNPYANKVVLANGQVLIDLTGDDVSASDVLSGKKFHLPSGAASTGSCTYDADTSDADAVAAESLSGKTAYKAGSKLTGTMPNRGAQTSYITSADTPVQILNGYHDGSGSVGIDSTELAKLIASNITSWALRASIPVKPFPHRQRQSILRSAVPRSYLTADTTI